jgi:hypothetical protein
MNHLSRFNEAAAEGKYKIKYTYDSGDSENNEYDLEGVIEISWSNSANAEQNLKRIEEHYEMYEEVEDSRWNKKTKQEILQEYQDKDWFVKKLRWVAYKKHTPDSWFAIDESDVEEIKKNPEYSVKQHIDEIEAKNCLILYTDEGKKFQFWAPWCGHFERLNLAEIIVDEPRKKYKPRR